METSLFDEIRTIYLHFIHKNIYVIECKYLKRKTLHFRVKDERLQFYSLIGHSRSRDIHLFLRSHQQQQINEKFSLYSNIIEL